MASAHDSANDNANATTGHPHDGKYHAIESMPHSPSTFDNWKHRQEYWEKLRSEEIPLEHFEVGHLQSALGIKLDANNDHPFVQFMWDHKLQIEKLQAKAKELAVRLETLQVEQTNFDQELQAKAKELAVRHETLQVEQTNLDQELISLNTGSSHDTTFDSGGTGQKRNLEEVLNEDPVTEDNKLLQERLERETLEEKRRNLESQRRCLESQRRCLESQRRCLESQRRLLEEKRLGLEPKRRLLEVDVISHINKVYHSHWRVWHRLAWYSENCCNEMTTNSQSTGNSSMDSYDSRVPREAPEKSPIIGVVVDMHDLLKDLKTEATNWTDDKEAQYLKKLEVLAKYFLQLLDLDEASADTGGDEAANKVKGTVTKILDPKFLDLSSPPKCDEKLNIRGLKENASVHPILHAIIYRVLGVVGLRELYMSKEHKTRSKIQDEKEHGVDFLVDEMQEQLIHFLPRMIEAAVEVKRCGRNDKKDKELFDCAVKRVIGKSAERLWGELNFLGIGVDCDLYGVAVSLSKISLIKASLQHVGTEQVEVTFIKTEPVALLTQEGLQLLALALSSAHSVNQFQAKHGDANIKTKVPGCGIEGEMTQISIGDWLGFGSFGEVYKVERIKPLIDSNAGYTQGCQDYFIKIPIFQRTITSLQDEAKVLRRLNQADQGHGIVPNIPSCKAATFFDFELNGFVGKTYGLLLNGIIGKRASAFDWKAECYKQHLPFVMEKVHDTLLAAHERCVYHLDVRSCNIIVAPKDFTGKSPGYMDVLLIDWSISIADDADFSFRGYDAYAHKGILDAKRTDERTKPKPEYDWASLLYTFYYLHEGEIPWQVWDSDDSRWLCDTDMREKMVLQWWKQKVQHQWEADHSLVQKLAPLLLEEKRPPS
ncbi:unnamed protein product [Cylindrotheca closterium]|uniref:Protein kinase domain-containing protein n=1 Tax=Cylindrotheca closterium TaxID=2856 RepID=A0AAD2FSG8_9STRA|nr:unnamed protein product [Cylindrotheca closterium]